MSQPDTKTTENQVFSPQSENRFEPWKTVTIPPPADPTSTYRELRAGGIDIDVTDAALDPQIFERESITFDLVKLTLDDLKPIGDRKIRSFLRTAKYNNLFPLPVRMAPRLWTTYPYLLDNENFYKLAIEPVKNLRGALCTYFLTNVYEYDGLIVNECHIDYRWEEDSGWILVSRMHVHEDH